MALERVAQQHYRQQATLVRDATDVVLQLWTSLGPDGYERELTRVAGVMAAGQLAAARQAADYVTAAAIEQGVPVGGVPDIVARAFAGQTADGLPLEQVLRAPLTRVKAMQAAGATADEAVRSGTATLTRLVSNEVTLAGTNATAVAMTANPGLDGYIRMLSRPSCGRCAIQAGKWFKWNQGFERHPGCDCVHVPAGEASNVDGLAANPRAYFDSLSKADQDRHFGKAEAEAIRGGADMGRTVNATSRKSGLTSGSASVKPSGGVARALERTETLDRDRATALLREQGYIGEGRAPSPTVDVPFDARPLREALSGDIYSALKEANRDASSAVYDYLSSRYHFINHYLRHGEVKPDSPWSAAELDDIVRSLDDAYDAVPTATKQDTHVFRGWSSSQQLDFKPGTVIEDRGFISTTTDLETADTFPGQLIAIRIRKGTKVLDLTGQSEAEVLLRRGTKFRVIGEETFDGFPMTVVEVVP